MKLQLLIPRHNEPEDVICVLLNSIAIQQYVDFNEIGVIICDDGSDTTLSPDFLNAFPFVIQYVVIPHSGVSAARQVCLDIAEADYVMWCDADDMFYTPIGILHIFRAIDDGGFNMMNSTFIEEARDENGNQIFREQVDDDIFVHGKIFNRNWLIENNINWDTSLTINEDSYFICLAQECCGMDFPNYRYCETPFYLWRYTLPSISRSDPKHYLVKTSVNLIDSMTALIRELFRRGMKDKTYNYCCSLVLTLYYYSNTNTFLDEENQEDIKKMNNRFKKFYQEFGYLFEEMSIQEKKDMAQDMRNYATHDFMNTMDFEHFTLDEWLHDVLKEEEEA